MPTEAWGLAPSVCGRVVDRSHREVVTSVFVANRPPTIGAEKATKPFVKWRIQPPIDGRIFPADS